MNMLQQSREKMSQQQKETKTEIKDEIPAGNETDKSKNEKLMREAIRGIIKCSETIYKNSTKPTSPTAKPVICRRAHSEPYSTTQSSFTRRKNKKGLSLTI